MNRVIQSVKTGLVALVLMGAVAAWGDDVSLPLDQQLARESSERLARDARDKGDATRGAILFHQPHLTCTRCHTVGERGTPLGPDLAQYDAPVGDSHLVESLLAPSKSIRKGFQTVTLVTDAGQSVTGFLVEEGADAIAIRDVSHDGQLLSLDTDTIDERSESGPSIMPEGLVNLLGGRQEFLDSWQRGSAPPTACA